MFQFIDQVRAFNRPTDQRSIREIGRTNVVVGQSADPVEMLAASLATPTRKPGPREGVFRLYLHNGLPVDFADIFRIVEGQEAFDAVMEDRAPAVDLESWVASKAA
jgi:hypothetical protein